MISCFSGLQHRYRFIPLTGLVAAALMLSACDLAKNNLKMDRSGNMEVQDYRDAMAPRLPEATEDAANSDSDSGIPSLQSYVAQPSDTVKPMPLVSVSVNQTVPLRDILFELAQQAGYDIELDPRITGSIIFTARNKPFDLVIKRISEIAGLRYNFEEDIVRVELDTPYSKTYKVDYLSYVRKNTGSINNQVSVVSGEGGADAGSNYKMSGESSSDLWTELQANLSQLLGSVSSSGNLKTGVDPMITAAEPNPGAVPVEPIIVKDEDGKEQVQVQPPAAVLQVSPLPTTVDGGAEAPAPAPGSFSINKQAGMVTVYATERQHELVREYLKEMKRSVTAQVLIEAKVLEVSLSDEFASGVDWGQMAQLMGDNLDINLGGFGLPELSPVPTVGSNLTITYASDDINAILRAMSRFGTVKALSSPRVKVLNNQSAVLNMANNAVYFKIDIDVTTDSGVTQVTLDSEAKTVPEGVLINVQPSIDLDNQKISMVVRPTVTRITGRVEDPAVNFVTQVNNIQGVTSEVPEVNVQEIDSVVSMNSGQAVLMGGLMQDRTDSEQTGVPVLSEVPVLGGLFRNQGDKVSKTELVIFLKATIVSDETGVDDTDRDMYKKFSGDRRPWKL